MTHTTGSPHQGTAPPRGLQDWLASRGHVSGDTRLSALSGGRTNNLWQVQTPMGRYVVKLYAPSDDNPLFDNRADLESLALSALADTDLAPQLLSTAQSPWGPVLIYYYVPGAPWRNGPEKVARALNALHYRAVPPAGFPHAPDGSMALADQTIAILKRCPPREAADLAALAPAGRVPPTALSAFLHGDTVAGNIIDGLAGVCFIDWQCPAAGDPVHDIATFLSPSMQLIYRGHPLAPEEIAQFFDAYGEPDVQDRYRSLAPWFHWRMAAYCLWRSSGGADDYKTALDHEIDRLRQAEAGS